MHETWAETDRIAPAQGQVILGNRVFADQRGATGLDGVVVLISLVALAAFFGLALFMLEIRPTHKSKEAALQSLAESTATLIMSGPVVGIADPSRTSLESVKFILSSGGRHATPANLSQTATRVTYVDGDQALHIPATQWSATWLVGSGPLLDFGETVEVQVTLTGLSPLLAAQRPFTLRLLPGQGSTLLISRTTPPEFTPIVILNPG